MANRCLPLFVALAVALALATPSQGRGAEFARGPDLAQMEGVPAGGGPPQCADGADNDLDEKTDFPDDPDCSSALDDDESASPVAPEVKARVLVAVATSGTLNGEVCNGVFTGGDGTALCPGSDVSCTACFAPTCGNLVPDDSRLAQVKLALADAFARDDAEFALLRAHQTARTFACPTADPLAGSGGWQGAPDANCAGDYNSGDVLVSFAADNGPGLMAYVGDSAAEVPAPGMDHQLRGTGARPLAGMLASADALFDAARATDAAQACRPYSVVLIADGATSCPGDAPAAAAVLAAGGAPVFVVGYAAGASDFGALDAIAAAGGSSAALNVDNTSELSGALDAIVEESALVELCNGSDDDCDNVVDEGYDVGAACSNAQLGACLREGALVCAGDGMTSLCDAPMVQPQEEACGNGTDEDCDGFTDEACGVLLVDGFESAPAG